MDNAIIHHFEARGEGLRDLARAAAARLAAEAKVV